MKFIVNTPDDKIIFEGRIEIMPAVGDFLFSPPHDPTSQYKVTKRTFDTFKEIVFLEVSI